LVKCSYKIKLDHFLYHSSSCKEKSQRKVPWSG